MFLQNIYNLLKSNLFILFNSHLSKCISLKKLQKYKHEHRYVRMTRILEQINYQILNIYYQNIKTIVKIIYNFC